MMHYKKNFLPFLFLTLGVILFILVYRRLDLPQLKECLVTLHYRWLLLTIPLSLAAIILRALRWQLLITPLGYRVGIYPLSLAVFQLYLANLLIPRSGELLRCGIITRYCKIPFPALVGTVVAERLTELAALLTLFLSLIVWKLPVFISLMHTTILPPLTLPPLFKWLLFTAIPVLSAAVILILLKLPSVRRRLAVSGSQFMQGFMTLRHTRAPIRFTIYTLLILVAWIGTLPLFFRSFDPTAHLSFSAAIQLFAAGFIASIVPVQGGIGIWHMIAVTVLLQLGIDDQSSRLFALILHTFISIQNIIFGVAGYLLLPTLRFFRQSAEKGNSGLKPAGQ